MQVARGRDRVRGMLQRCTAVSDLMGFVRGGSQAEELLRILEMYLYCARAGAGLVLVGGIAFEGQALATLAVKFRHVTRKRALLSSLLHFSANYYIFFLLFLCSCNDPIPLLSSTKRNTRCQQPQGLGRRIGFLS